MSAISYNPTVIEDDKLIRMGAEQHVASMGSLKTRKESKLRRAKMKRDKRIETGLRSLVYGLGMQPQSTASDQRPHLIHLFLNCRRSQQC